MEGGEDAADEIWSVPVKTFHSESVLKPILDW